MARGQKTAQTQTLIDYLLDCHNKNQTALFVDMTQLIDLDVMVEGRPYLDSARRYLKRNGLFFQSVHSIGYQPVPYESTPRWILLNRTAQIHRRAQLCKNDLNKVDTKKLNLTATRDLDNARVINTFQLESSNPYKIEKALDDRDFAKRVKEQPQIPDASFLK